MHVAPEDSRLAVIIAAALTVSPSLAWAQPAQDTDASRNESTTSSQSRARDPIRPRWGIAMGGFGGHLESEQLSRLCTPPPNEYEGWTCVEGDPRHVQPGTGGPLISAQAGVQSDYFGAFLLVRGIFGLATMEPGQILVLPFHLTVGIVAELTLFHFLQIGLGGSVDGLVVADSSSYLAAAEGRNPAGIGPGFEIRLGAASGGGPYERRGFVATGFFHMSFVGVTTAALGGLEIGFESF